MLWKHSHNSKQQGAPNYYCSKNGWLRWMHMRRISCRNAECDSKRTRGTGRTFQHEKTRRKVASHTNPSKPKACDSKGMQDWEWKRQAKLYSLRLFCIMVSLTAQNTIRMFSVSYARKACKREERKGGRERNNTSGTGQYKMRQTKPGDM